MGERPMGFAKLIACKNPVWDGCVGPVNSPEIAWHHVVGLHVVQQVVLVVVPRHDHHVRVDGPVAGRAGFCSSLHAPRRAQHSCIRHGQQVLARTMWCVHGARGCDVARCDRAGLAVMLVARGALIVAEVDRHSVREAAA